MLKKCLVMIALIALVFSLSCKKSEVRKIMKNEKNPVVKMITSEGSLFIELYEELAPISVDNFLSYVDEGFYDGTVFHRVINDFMIQGGGFLPGMEQKATKEPIKNEATNGLKNDKGTLAMARTSDVDSATSQFFINTVDNNYLNHRSERPQEYGYAVFGKVIAGIDVLEKIENVETTQVSYYSDVPKKDVVIESVILLKK